MKRPQNLLPSLVCALLMPLVAHAERATDKSADADAVARGRAIAEEADRRDAGFKDSTAAIMMILTSPNGQESRRILRIKILENLNPAEGDKSMVVFDRPRDIAGTALLSYANILEPDDQWLLLPEVGRVKRISGSNRAGPFMGSEYAYEDLSAPELDKYTYKYLREEPCGNLQCVVIDRTPRYRDSGYKRQEMWLDTEEYRPWRVDFYDRRNRLLKQLTYTDYRRYGKHWRSHDMLMTNLRTRKTTRLAVHSYQLGVGLSDSDFTRSSLQRAQ